MKSLLLGLSLLYTTMAFAQSTNTRRVQIGQNSIVKDEAGAVYPYAVWSKLTSSGEFGLKPLYPKTLSDTSTFVLYKLTDEQKTARQANLPKPTESTFFKVGTTLTPFKDSDLNGVKLDTRKLSGKVLVLNFWFINCPPCRQEIPDLSAMADSYKDNNDVVFIAIALDQTGDVKDYLKLHPLNYHILTDGRWITEKYSLTSYPTNVVVDGNGKIVFSSTGGYPGNVKWMKTAINNALAETKN